MSLSHVYIVTKNADFTEGRGPMLFHSVWDSIKGAIVYVENQPGIYGSDQAEEIPAKVNTKGNRQWAYNGYDIEEVPVSTGYDIVAINKARNEMDRLKDSLKAAEKRYNDML